MENHGYNLKSNNDELLDVTDVPQTGPGSITDSNIKYFVVLVYNSENNEIQILAFNPDTFRPIGGEDLATFKTTYANTTFWFEEVGD